MSLSTIPYHQIESQRCQSTNMMTPAAGLFLVLLILTLKNTEADGNARVKRSDDVNMTSLQAVVEQQTTLVQSMQAELEEEKSRSETVETDLRNKLTAVQNEIAALQSSVTALSKTGKYEK